MHLLTCFECFLTSCTEGFSNDALHSRVMRGYIFLLYLYKHVLRCMRLMCLWLC